jgi:hypothetical protein
VEIRGAVCYRSRISVATETLSCSKLQRLEYAIERVRLNQDGLKLNGTHQLLACADDVNILGGSVHTVKENA